MLLKLMRTISRSACYGAALLTAAGLASAQQPAAGPPSAPTVGEVLLVHAERPQFPIAPVTRPKAAPTPVAAPPAPVAALPAPALVIAPPAPDTADDLKARIERLERQNQELLEALRGLRAVQTTTQPPIPTTPQSAEAGAHTIKKDDVQKIVGDYLKTRDATKKKEEEAKKKEADLKGFTVGQNLNLQGKWVANQYWFESPDKAFRLHPGGRTQFDIIGVTADPNVIHGRGGIGEFDSAVNFRRARFAMEGTFWEVFDFNCEYDFLNTFDYEPLTPHTPNAGTVANTPAPTDLWIQFTHLPWIGHIRAGNHKPWIGFEHLTSSRFLNFLERSYLFDAFIEEGNNGFSPGVSVWNTYGPDDRIFAAVGAFHTQRNIFGWNVGDGEWGATGRVSALPVWRDHGRTWVHVGLGASFKDLDDDVVRFRARPLLRNGPAALHNIVAISQLRARNETLVVPEFAWNFGPWQFQAEYAGAWVNGSDRILRTPVQNGVNIARRDYYAQGFDAQLLYFLTGEHRPYNRKVGTLDRVVPFRNFFWVPTESGGTCLSGGAWQVGARYSYLDLNDNGIFGGELHGFSAVLNWYLNPNFKIQGDYSWGYRNIPTGTSSGDFQGVGVRFAWDW